MNISFSNISSHIHSNMPTKSVSEFLRSNNQIVSTFTNCNTANILKIFSKMKPTTSYGLDGILIKTIKFCGEELAQLLCHIIRNSIVLGILPKIFKIYKIKPINKKLQREN